MDPCHLPPWHHHPGMHCHTPNRNVSLLFEIHTSPRSPEAPRGARAARAWAHIKAQESPGFLEALQALAQRGDLDRTLPNSTGPEGSSTTIFMLEGGGPKQSSCHADTGLSVRPAWLTPVNWHLKEVSQGGSGPSSAATLYLHSRKPSEVLAHPAGGSFPQGGAANESKVCQEV